MSGSSAARQDANYRLVDARESPETGLSHDLAALIRTYIEIFAYGVVARGNDAVLIERLLMLETSGAALDARIGPLWRELTQNAITVAEDGNKQRLDRLFGLDGKAGLLGEMERFRRVAAEELPAMSGAQQGAISRHCAFWLANGPSLGLARAGETTRSETKAAVLEAAAQALAG